MKLLTKKQLSTIKYNLIHIMISCAMHRDSLDRQLWSEIIVSTAAIADAAGGQKMLMDMPSRVPDWKHFDKEVKHADD